MVDIGQSMMEGYRAVASSRGDQEKKARARRLDRAERMTGEMEFQEAEVMKLASSLNIGQPDPSDIGPEWFIKVYEEQAKQEGLDPQVGLDRALNAMRASGMDWVLGDNGRRMVTGMRRTKDEEGNDAIALDIGSISRRDQRKFRKGKPGKDMDIHARRNYLTFGGAAAADGGEPAVLSLTELDSMYRAHSWTTKKMAGQEPSLALLGPSEYYFSKVLEDADYLADKEEDDGAPPDNKMRDAMEKVGPAVEGMKARLDELEAKKGNYGTGAANLAAGTAQTGGVYPGLTTEEAQEYENLKQMFADQGKVLDTTQPKSFHGLYQSGKAEDSGKRGKALYDSILSMEVTPMDDTTAPTVAFPLTEQYSSYVDFSDGKNIPFFLTVDEWESLNTNQKTRLKKQAEEQTKSRFNSLFNDPYKKVTDELTGSKILNKVTGKVDPEAYRTDEETFRLQNVKDFYSLGNRKALRDAMEADKNLYYEFLIDPVSFADKYTDVKQEAGKPRVVTTNLPKKPVQTKQEEGVLKEIKGTVPEKDRAKLNTAQAIQQYIEKNPGAFVIDQNRQGQIVMGINKNKGQMRHWSRDDRMATVGAIMSSIDPKDAITLLGQMDDFIETGQFDASLMNNRQMTRGEMQTAINQDNANAKYITEATFTPLGSDEPVSILSWINEMEENDPRDDDFNAVALKLTFMAQNAKGYMGGSSINSVNLMITKFIQKTFAALASEGIRSSVEAFFNGDINTSGFHHNPDIIAIGYDGNPITDPGDINKIDYFVNYDQYFRGKREGDISLGQISGALGVDMMPLVANIAIMNYYTMQNTRAQRANQNNPTGTP